MENSLAKSTSELTLDDVKYAYRLFLGREPENEFVAKHHLSASTTRHDLITTFFRSPEFLSSGPPTITSGIFSDRLSSRMNIDYAATPEQISQMLDRIFTTWRSLGTERPHWSVISTDEYLPERMDDENSFFESDASDANQLLSILDFCGRKPRDFASVNEYGCGVGRITNHLARHFKSVVAHDISPPHLALAKKRSTEQGLSNIEYVHCSDANFGMHDKIDLWFSVIVLQHNPPPIIRLIVERALMLLKPGGLAIFQAPTHGPNYTFAAADYLRRDPGASFEMHPIDQSKLFELVDRLNCRVVSVLEDYRCGPSWISNMFVVEKLARTPRW